MRHLLYAVVCCTAAAFLVPPQTRSTMPQTPRHASSSPRDVTPEQAEKMKDMGFRWDEERRTWTRRPPDVKKPPKPLRSGMRLLKLGDASPDERAAAEVFMERLRTARKASFRDTDTSTKLSKFLKYCLSQPATLPVFAVACVGLGVAAAANGGADVGSLDATTLSCGLIAGVPVAAARVGGGTWAAPSWLDRKATDSLRFSPKLKLIETRAWSLGPDGLGELPPVAQRSRSARATCNSRSKFQHPKPCFLSNAHSFLQARD